MGGSHQSRRPIRSSPGEGSLRSWIRRPNRWHPLKQSNNNKIDTLDGPSNKLTIFIAKILKDARTLASRLDHRGACSCDNDTGDGAGVLTAIPHQLYSSIIRYKHINTIII